MSVVRVAWAISKDTANIIKKVKKFHDLQNQIDALEVIVKDYERNHRSDLESIDIGETDENEEAIESP